MAYDPAEEEQLEALKLFWKRYGNFILTVVLVVALAVSGWRGWQWYQTDQSAKASAVYEQLREAAGSKNVDKVRDMAGQIFASYSGTVWAQMAALVAAGAYLEAADPGAAKVTLQWAIDKAPDPAYREEARLRLAGILLDEKAYADGLKLVAEASDPRYAGAFADRRGDLLTAEGRLAEARTAYEQALAKLPGDNALRRLVQIKLDALGGGGAA